MSHESLMREAVRLAKRGVGKTSPNPAVGAVVSRGGHVVSGGWHKKAGLPHAEIEALRAAGKNARGATLHVTLEPCCHFGRTPPCTDAIIASGIKKVVVGAPDPNPKVSGKGVRALRAAGIEVVEGVLAKECEAMNEAYSKYISKGLPFVALKLASSLDGRIATSAGESKWITGIESRRLVHRMRARYDAVMVGAKTALKDDPELTVRLVKGKNPVRVVLDSTLSVPIAAKVFKGVKEGGARLLIFTSMGVSAKKAEKLAEAGAEVIRVPARGQGLDLKKVLRELAKREVTSLLVEGGGSVAATLLRERLVDKLFAFYGPMVLGADSLAAVAPLGLKWLKDAPRFEIIGVRKAGKDILIEAAL